MEQMSLEATPRSGHQASVLRRLRESGQVPAVLYGGSQGPVNVAVPEKWFRSGHIHGGLISIELNGTSLDAVIREVQKDPLTGRVQHADFLLVNRNQAMDTKVAIHLHGLQEVERKGGIVQQQTRQITVYAKPSETPEYISVDVSHLAVGESMQVADIVLPPGIKLRSGRQEVICSVLAPRQVVTMDEATIEPTS